MKKISNVIEDIIDSNPFLNSLIDEGLINYSALAKKLQPRIEKELGKEVKEGGIVMSLRRHSTGNNIKTQKLQKVLTKLQKIEIQSGLTYYSLKSTPEIIQKYEKIRKNSAYGTNSFIVFTQGINEAFLLFSEDKKEIVDQYFTKDDIIQELTNMCGITITLNEDDWMVPGLFHTIFRQIAWNSINVFEVLSTVTELCILVDDKDTDKVFSVIKNIKIELF